MDELLEQAGDSVKQLTVGDTVQGKVLSVKKHEILIDLGANGVGMVPRREASFSRDLEVGQEVSASVIDTEMNSKLDEQIKKEIINETPLGKIGKPEDIYRCARWLIEDEFTTGQVISVNGGYVI